MDVQTYTKEKVFQCKSVGKGCPQLSHEWGVITVTDPSDPTVKEVFRDVQAGHIDGKGYVKEWNWGHHEPHTTHDTGAGLKEFREMAHDMAGYLSPTKISKLMISEGVNGVLKANTDGGAWAIDSFEETEPFKPSLLEVFQGVETIHA